MKKQKEETKGINDAKVCELLRDKLRKAKIPFYSLGIVSSRTKKERYIEVVIKRPEKWNARESLFNKIPRYYHNISVRIV